MQQRHGWGNRIRTDEYPAYEAGAVDHWAIPHRGWLFAQVRGLPAERYLHLHPGYFTTRYRERDSNPQRTGSKPVVSAVGLPRRGPAFDNAEPVP